MIPSDLRYTEEHEWVRVENDVAIVGITQHAVDELGEIVFVDLPEIGRQIGQMEEFGSVESVKTISSLYLPVSGEVIEINSELSKNPGYVNESPYDDGWLIKVSLGDEKEIDDLMTAEEYKNFLETL
ncbi:glycine cleavage system protein GcvH [bacterium]|nr:glycine cleavage system protein GcvH [bacterium]